MAMSEHQCRKIAKSAGIKGSTWQGREAIEDFIGEYITYTSLEERKSNTAEIVRKIAKAWWASNHHLYPVGNDLE